MVTRRKMLETRYRASRFCRVLGNPTAYEILSLLIKSDMTPTELKNKIGLSLKTISETLRNLRQVDMVRYITKGNTKRYFIKDKLVAKVLDRLELYVDRMRMKKW